jgi:hypothetical protein
MRKAAWDLRQLPLPCTMLCILEFQTCFWVEHAPGQLPSRTPNPACACYACVKYIHMQTCDLKLADIHPSWRDLRALLRAALTITLKQKYAGGHLRPKPAKQMRCTLNQNEYNAMCMCNIWDSYKHQCMHAKHINMCTASQQCMEACSHAVVCNAPSVPVMTVNIKDRDNNCSHAQESMMHI